MSPGDSCRLYGPVPSRRLGRSLGVDLVPFKTCSYDCVYCQLGRTTDKTIRRKEYVRVESLLVELKRRLEVGPAPDYITLAGSGEPTLHSGIGRLIRRIKRLTSIPVAVLTNGSLLWMPEVRKSLLAADLVIPSLDAGDEKLFYYVNRPHPGITFDRMTEGLAEFTRATSGPVWLEVFLLGGVTGIRSEVKKIATLVKKIDPARVQLNTVTRPPAEDFAFAVSRDELNRLARLIPGTVEVVSEARRVSPPRNRTDRPIEEEVLALLRRRPCTTQDVARGLASHVIVVLKLLERLVSTGKVRTTVAGDHTFYSVTGYPGPESGGENPAI